MELTEGTTSNHDENAISLMDISAFVDKMETAIEKKQAFSFVRVGDGEGALLDLTEDSAFFDIDYLSQHFGENCSIKEALEIQAILYKTITSSDILGLMDDIINVNFQHDKTMGNKSFLKVFQQAFNPRKNDKNLCYADARRIAMLHKAFSEIEFSKATQFSSAYIGWELYSSGAVPYIISKQKKIAIISARDGIDKVIANAFDIDVIQYQIPDKFELEPNHSTRHYPTSYYELINQIQVEFPGMLFIVAGGIIGKGYCQVIKERGGIALDLGAVVDTWVGLLSRPNPLKERYKLKRSLKFRMRRKCIPWFYFSFNVPEELIMNKNNTSALIQKWLNK